VQRRGDLLDDVAIRQPLIGEVQALGLRPLREMLVQLGAGPNPARFRQVLQDRLEEKEELLIQIGVDAVEGGADRLAVLGPWISSV
jgi:hypothetical protein